MKVGVRPQSAQFVPYTMECQVPIARNKLPTLRSNSCLRTQASVVKATTYFCSAHSEKRQYQLKAYCHHSSLL